MQRTRYLALAAGVALLAGCSPAKKPEAAAAAAPPSGRDAARVETGDVVTALMAATFNAEQQGRILNMGYYMAASALCSDLEVDAQKLGRAVEATLALGAADASDAQKQHEHDAVLMFLGMSSGSIIGSHAEDKAAFCDDAKKLKGGAADTHLFAAGAPSAPSTAPLPEAPAAPAKP
ncbi:hypothetical protein [uncultured Phenylobacterium sp.]|uniref:hypothetical protein n=1 Tax=uncultured Phenylobacterium sp. TaxID=349273 RepID=UPI0025E1B3B5|nr:hypothetical protein [uncultured Phenylobacterium sp.]